MAEYNLAEADFFSWLANNDPASKTDQDIWSTDELVKQGLSELNGMLSLLDKPP